MSRAEVRNSLLEQLKKQNCFWSYDASHLLDVTDDMLIEKSLVYLDLPDIDRLIALYGKRHVKRLVPQEDYLHTLNRFLGWYYFDVKRPDTYLRQQATRHLKKIIA